MKHATPFKRTENGKYYFRYVDLNGNRTQKCTNTTDYKEAVLIMKAFMKKLSEPDIPTFKEELMKYQNVETNPKFRQAKIDGSHYSEAYAISTTYKAKQLEQICLKHCAELLIMKLDEITRRDAKRLTEAIVEEVGHCRSAQILQQLIKVIFSEAFQDGVIQLSPTQGQKIIKYEEKERCAIPNEWISWVIDNPKLFKDTNTWAYFTVAATTGMRRSEILALSTDQIKGDVIRIDRSLKGAARKSEIGLPKWDIIRTIPISKITQEALGSVIPDKNTSRYFYQNDCWVQKIFDDLKSTLRGIDIEHEELWKDLTSHVLRHSFNTNLIVSGIDSNLVAEYLGWKHQQKLLDMQQRYTHFITKHLRSVSEEVDEIYTYQQSLLEAL